MKRGVDFTGVSIIFFCHDGQGKYLVGKRSQKCRDEQGHWDPGGGGLEHGELLEEGIRREVKEEYGAEVQEMEYMGFREVLRNNNGAKTHWIAFDFRVLVNPSEVHIAEPDMMDDISWVSVDEVPEPQHSQFLAFLAKYKSQLR